MRPWKSTLISNALRIYPLWMKFRANKNLYFLPWRHGISTRRNGDTPFLYIYLLTEDSRHPRTSLITELKIEIHARYLRYNQYQHSSFLTLSQSFGLTHQSLMVPPVFQRGEREFSFSTTRDIARRLYNDEREASRYSIKHGHERVNATSTGTGSHAVTSYFWGSDPQATMADKFAELPHKGHR